MLSRLLVGCLVASTLACGRVEYEGGDASDAGGAGYARAVLASSPVAYYRLDEPPDASEARDSSGNGHHGVYVGVGAMLGTAGATSDGNTALNVAGDRLTALGSVALGALLSEPDAWTYELWVRPRHVTYVERFAGLVGETNNPRLTFDTMDASIDMGAEALARMWALGPNYIVSPLDRWYHVVAVWENASTAARATLYVDGTLVGLVEHGFAIRRPSGGHVIAQRDCCNHFDGVIDDVAIYDRALSAAEISAHFAAR